MGSVRKLKYFFLHDLAPVSITDAVMDSLHTDENCRLGELTLGYVDRPQKINFTATAFTRSGREARAIDTHPGNYAGCPAITPF